MALYDTAANVINDAAVELGLGAVSDPYAETDENFVQLRYLLKTLGRELFLRNGWLQGQREHVFVTDGSASYALPADFDRMIDQTGWSRTDMRPVLPATPQEWQYLQATMNGTVLTVIFRPFDLTLKIWPTSSTGVTVAFEYLSRYWIRATASAAPDKDFPTANDDVIHLDALLAVKGLKLSFLRSKGFDTTAAQGELDSVLDGSKSARSNAAPVLNITHDSCDDILREPSVVAQNVIIYPLAPIY